MNSDVHFNLYDTLTEAGFLPGPARKIEKHLDGAMAFKQAELRAELRDSLATKADLRNEISALKSEMSKLEVSLLKAGSAQLNWIVGTMFATAGLTVTLIKLL